MQLIMMDRVHTSVSLFPLQGTLETLTCLAVGQTAVPFHASPRQGNLQFSPFCVILSQRQLPICSRRLFSDKFTHSAVIRLRLRLT